MLLRVVHPGPGLTFLAFLASARDTHILRSTSFSQSHDEETR